MTRWQRGVAAKSFQLEKKEYMDMFSISSIYSPKLEMNASKISMYVEIETN